MLIVFVSITLTIETGISSDVEKREYRHSMEL